MYYSYYGFKIGPCPALQKCNSGRLEAIVQRLDIRSLFLHDTAQIFTPSEEPSFRVDLAALAMA